MLLYSVIWLKKPPKCLHYCDLRKIVFLQLPVAISQEHLHNTQITGSLLYCSSFVVKPDHGVTLPMLKAQPWYSLAVEFLFFAKWTTRTGRQVKFIMVSQSLRLWIVLLSCPYLLTSPYPGHTGSLLLPTSLGCQSLSFFPPAFPDHLTEAHL